MLNARWRTNSEIRPPSFERNRALRHKLSLLTLAFLLGSIVAFAQAGATPNISGTYEGMLKRPGATTEEKVSLELKSEGGKITGRATHGQMTADVLEAKLENGTLTLIFGPDAMFVAKVDGDKLVGAIVHGAEKTPLELKKVTPATPANTAAPAAVNLDGQWEGVADADGQPFPFLLTLKIDGEKVTGSSSSQLGEATIKTGSWKDGKLAFQLEGQNGTITMSATVIEGKLSGEYDYAGQLAGKWVAVKKN